jgi:hypothetical protein
MGWAAAQALGAVKCMKLNRTAFVEILGPLESVWRVAQLQRVPLFANLMESQLLQLADKLEVLKVSRFRCGSRSSGFPTVAPIRKPT